MDDLKETNQKELKRLETKYEREIAAAEKEKEDAGK
jgi:hypothetical protein